MAGGKDHRKGKDSWINGYTIFSGSVHAAVGALQRAGGEITNYRGSGMSVMEMSHRSKVFDTIFQETKAKLRRLMSCRRSMRFCFYRAEPLPSFPWCL